MSDLFVVHYAEVALKGNNRPEFVRSLRHGLNRALSGIDHEITLSDGRFLVEAAAPCEEMSRRLSHVFGVSWFAPVTRVGADYAQIESAVLHAARTSPEGSFRIVARRSDKSFPLGSQDLAARLGAQVVRTSNRAVDLSAPTVTIHVDVTKGGTLIYTDRRQGPGGLPLGTAGRTVLLFSGGIDSPVAAWLLMKRGTVPVYLHFYLAPTPKSAVESKITELLRILSDYGGKSTLVLLPFAEYQISAAGAPAELEPSLFRRFMRMTAESLAARFGATAIATGDSLSQAASQTLWNIASFDENSTLPILRPLLTYDKDEIISLARSIGTYETSLKDYKDCCAMITRHPRTRVRGDVLDAYVDKLGLQALVEKTVQKATLVTYSPAGQVLKTMPFAEAMAVVRADDRGPPSSR